MEEPLLNYIEFSVVLNAAEIFIDTAREWFLRRHSILEEETVVERLENAAPFVAGIRTDKHLRIFAEPDRFVVEQSGFGLLPSTNRTGELMLKYLNVVPMSECYGVGINFKGVLVTGSQLDGQRPISRLLASGGKWASVNGATPAIHLDANYTLENGEVSVKMEDVKSTDQPVQVGVLFTGNIHRALPNSDDLLNSTLSDIVSRWRRDMELFEKVVELFKTRLVRS